MTLALIANAVIGLSLLAVVLTLLSAAIRRSHIDYRIVAARRRQVRGHRRATARPRTGWAPRTDAS